MSELSREDRLLLELLQGRFPLSPVPFTDLAERLRWGESAVLERIRVLKEAGPLRQIGAIFDTRRLGYASTLVALAVRPERLEEVGQAVSRHPGVSHNYSRAHRFNLWFTLAVPPGTDLQREVLALASQPGVLAALDLPALRLFKIALRLDLDAAGEPGEELPAAQPAPGELLAAADIPLVRALQDDLPLVQRPFRLLAQREALEEAALLDGARRLLETGVMRRYGATLRHRQAGYTANAMVAWEVAEEEAEAAGMAAATHGSVSHCYERPAYPPAWPYRLFTMVHSRSQDELAARIRELEALIRPCGYAVLPTVHEFKKVRLRYFEEGNEGTTNSTN